MTMIFEPGFTRGFTSADQDRRCTTSKNAPEAPIVAGRSVWGWVLAGGVG
jgi:hypothetical protein